MTNRRALLVAVGAAAGTAIAIGFVLALVRPAERQGESAAVRRDRPVALLPVSERKPLPAVGGPTLLAPPPELRLRELRGRPLYLDVWASWCQACRDEAPAIARLARRYGRTIRFVGIDTQDRAAAGRKFAREFALDFPHLFDPSSEIALRLGVYGVPTGILVDRRGRIAAVLVGKQGERRLATALRLLANDDAST